MDRHQRVLTALVSAGVVAGVLAGCSSESTPVGESSSASADRTSAARTDDPKALLDAAANSTAELDSAHLQLAVTGKVPGLKATALDADVAKSPKNAAKGDATVLVGTDEVKAPFVYSDGKLYANVGGAGYLDYGDGKSIYDVTVVLDDKRGLPNILRQMAAASPATPPSAVPDPTSDVDTTAVAAQVPLQALAPILGTVPPEQQKKAVPVTAWIASDSPQRLVRLQVTPAPGAAVTIDLSKWDEPVTVSAPPAVSQPSEKPTEEPEPGQPTREKADG
ncbi:LppX_LprAFG lipoprotein [Gordonia soli]|uniref:Lipoprotein n=1 Tax=Gordonia soli NBRC 108243 TaxID=1223545 RepID=M0QNW6_9ACTN|nr:LppX_LprAFG lipoprotein [Gordonia soli]GAC69132.1 hypothetical protein GS4_20_01980 [Gordonia soli NBRC 108243]